MQLSNIANPGKIDNLWRKLISSLRAFLVLTLFAIVAIRGNGVLADVIVDTDNGTITGDGAYADAIALDKNYTVTPNFGNTITLNGVVSGTGFGLTLESGGLTLSGANTYTGTTTINNSGTLTFAVTTAANALSGYTFAGDGTLHLDLSASDTKTTANYDNFTGTIQIANANWSANTKLNSSGSNFADKSGITVDILSQAQVMVNSNTACSFLIAGTGNRETRGAIRLEANISGAVTLSNNATIAANGTSTATKTISGAISSTAAGDDIYKLTFGSASEHGSATFSGIISDGSAGGKLAIEITNGAELTLSNANTYTGGTTITNGTLKITGTSASTFSVATGSVLEWNTTSGKNLTQAISGAGTLKLTGNGTSNSHFTITNLPLDDFTGSVRIEGARAQVDNKTFSVGVSVSNNGQLYVTGTVTGALTIAGTGTTETAGALGVLRLQNGTLNGSIALFGNASVMAYGGTGTVNSTIDLAGHTLTIAQSGDSGQRKSMSLNGIISDSSTDKTGALVLNTTAQTTLSGANTYSGGTTLKQGTVVFSNDKAFGDGQITLEGGTFQQSGARTLANNIAVTGTVAFAMGTDQNMRLNGNLTGAGTINRSGNYTLQLFGDNSGFTGTLNANESNTYLYTVDSGSANATWNIASGATLAACIQGTTAESSNHISLGAITGSGTLRNDTVGTVIYDVGGKSINSTFSGAIINGNGGTIGINKVGTSTLTLSGNNTYTGTTTVSAGRLELAGAGTLNNSSSLNVAANSILSFSSTGNNVLDSTKTTIAGRLNVNDGAKVATVGTISVGSWSTNESSLFLPQGGATMTVAGTDLANNAVVTVSGGGTLNLTSTPQVLSSSSMKLRLDASTISGVTSGSAITSWADSSGSNNNATANTTTGITYQTDTTTGLPSVVFSTDGNSSFSFNRISDIRTVFWVAKDGSTNNQSFLLGDGSTYHFHRGGNGEIFANYKSEVYNGSITLNGNIVSPSAKLNQGKWDLLSLVTTGDAQANTLAKDRNINSRSWDGSISEVIIFNEALTAEQVQEVNAYLNQKWNMGLTGDYFQRDFISPNTSLVLTDDTTVNAAGFSSIQLKELVAADGKTATIIQDAGTVWNLSNVQGNIVSQNSSGTPVMFKVEGAVMEIAGAGTTGTAAFTSPVDISGNAINFDVTGMGDELFDVLSSTSTIDLTDDVISIIFGAAYTPQLGDSFDIITSDIENGITGFDSIQFVFDTSQINMIPDTSWYAALSADGKILSIEMAVPEPSTWALLILGAAGLMLFKRRK